MEILLELENSGGPGWLLEMGVDRIDRMNTIAEEIMRWRAVGHVLDVRGRRFDASVCTVALIANTVLLRTTGLADRWRCIFDLCAYRGRACAQVPSNDGACARECRRVGAFKKVCNCGKGGI